MGDDDKRVHPFLLSGLLFWLRRKVFAPMKRLLEAKMKMAELRSLHFDPNLITKNKSIKNINK